MTPLVDSHLDLAWNALSWNRDLTLPLEELRAREAMMTDHPARGRAVVSLPELRAAGVVVAVATLLSRAKAEVRPSSGFGRADLDYATQSIAHSVAQGQLAYYRLLQEQGEVRIIVTADELDAHLKQWQVTSDHAKKPIGIIIAMEGADPIVAASEVPRWWIDGLRLVGLAHYGQGCYAVGTGASGPLTAEGRELVKALDQGGFALDLTHCAEPGFFEALELFGGPVLASHNNCRALVEGDRQFSDEQIHAILRRGGVIGVAFDAWMLSPDWKSGATSKISVPLEKVADHVDHICQLAGDAKHVGIGTDLDGGFGNEQTPSGVERYRDIRRLEEILARRQYSSTDIAAIMGENWIAFLRHALGRASEV